MESHSYTSQSNMSFHLVPQLTFEWPLWKLPTQSQLNWCRPRLLMDSWHTWTINWWGLPSKIVFYITYYHKWCHNYHWMNHGIMGFIMVHLSSGWETPRKLVTSCESGYPLVNSHHHGKIHHFLNGKIHYFYGPFSIAMLIYPQDEGLSRRDSPFVLRGWAELATHWFHYPSARAFPCHNISLS